MRSITLAIGLLISGVSGASAVDIPNPDENWLIPLNIAFSSPGSHEPFADHTLYRVSFECKPRSALPRQSIVDLFKLKTVTTSHYIVISNDMVGVDTTSGKAKLPEKPLRMITPFAVNGNNVVDLRSKDLCPKPFVASGTKPIFVYPAASYSTNNQPGAIVKVGYALLKLVPAVWAAFEPIPTPISAKISSVSSTEDPLKAIFSTFNEDRTYATGFALQTGRYVVTTDYSEVAIIVARMPSVVRASPTSLQEAFRAQLKDAPEQISADDVVGTCTKIAAALKDAGFSEDEDIPYALTTLASKLGKREKMVACLDRYADPAIKLGSILWSWLPAGLQITDAYLASLQPGSFPEAKAKLFDLIVALSRISKGDPARREEGLATLKLVTKDSVTLTDRTPDGIVNPTGLIKSPDLAQSFIGSQYKRFGCMAPVGDNNGKSVDNAVASFLAIKADIDASGAEIGDALLVHVMFERGLVSALNVYNDRAWVTVNATANDGNCNGFKLRGTPKAIAFAQ